MERLFRRVCREDQIRHWQGYWDVGRVWKTKLYWCNKNGISSAKNFKKYDWIVMIPFNHFNIYNNNSKMSNAKLENLSKFVKKLFLSRKLICKIHRTKQKELEKFNLQSFYFVLNMIKSRKIFIFVLFKYVKDVLNHIHP